MSASAAGAYNPSYVYSRNPSKYGGHQDDYVHKANISIEYIVDRIKSAVKRKKDLETEFFNSLTCLASIRNFLAVIHGTRDAEAFGYMRTRGKIEGSDYFTTCLPPKTGLFSEEYQRYNDLALKRLSDVMRSMVSEGKFLEKSKTIEEEVLGKRVIFNVQLISRRHIIDNKWNSPIKDYELPEEIKGSKRRTMQSYLQDIDFLKQLSIVSPDIYERAKMGSIIQFLNDCFPQRAFVPHKSGFEMLEDIKDNFRNNIVLASTSIEIDGRIYELSRLLTWVYTSKEEDVIERMKKVSKVLVFHQDTFTIDDMLNEISKLFKKIIEWDKQDKKKLINDMAMFRYLFSHCMPFSRGSAAVAEWLETAIYTYHGFRVNVDGLLDLEAFSSLTLSEFLQRYKSLVSLE